MLRIHSAIARLKHEGQADDRVQVPCFLAFFDIKYGSSGRQASAFVFTKHIRVKDKCSLYRGFPHYHVSGFAGPPGRALQQPASEWYGSFKMVVQHTQQGTSIFCPIAKEPNGLGAIANACLAQRSYLLGLPAPRN